MATTIHYHDTLEELPHYIIINRLITLWNRLLNTLNTIKFSISWFLVTEITMPLQAGGAEAPRKGILSHATRYPTLENVAHKQNLCIIVIYRFMTIIWSLTYRLRKRNILFIYSNFYKYWFISEGSEDVFSMRSMHYWEPLISILLSFVRSKPILDLKSGENSQKARGFSKILSHWNFIFRKFS